MCPPLILGQPLLHLLVAMSTLFAGCALAIGTEREVIFTAKDIQAAVEKSPKSAKLLDGNVVVALQGLPTFKLGEPPHRVGVSANFTVQAIGARPVPVSFMGSANVVYSVSKKAFFIDAPLVDSIESSLIPKSMEVVVSQAITRHLTNMFSATPVYTLRQTGNIKEQAIAASLKSIEIRKDEVVARFAM